MLVRMEQSGQLLVQLTDLLLEDLQLLERHFHEPAVHGLELRARAERITQLVRRGAQSLMRQSGQRCWIGFSVSQRVQHRSEEHTSELQSLRHLVCRLLLEKKKK